MSEEKEQSEQKTEEKTEIDKKPNLEALNKMDELLAKLEEKEKILLEKETAIDKRLKEFEAKEMEIRKQGSGYMRVEKSAEEKAEDSAFALIAGTGLEKYAFPNRKK